ncbi:hypothetical protein ACFL6P_07835 [Candidatus Latescibacterota bacterium]
MPTPLKKSFAAEQLRQRKTGMSPGMWIVFLIVIAVIVGIFALYSRYIAPPPEEAPITSLAVLPLDNISDEEYFADGMHEALITHLSKIGALRIISRTSVMQFKDTKPTIPEIAKKLNVDAVVEGSVYRADNTVRITVQLIQAEPEQHLWAKDFVRELEDVIMMQQEVARAIADEIKITVTPEEKKLLSSSPKVNPEAYDYYLRGKNYRNPSLEDDLRISLQFYQKAIDLDPTFALAYAMISNVHRLLYWYYFDRTPERLAKAKEAVDTALEINPDLPEAHVSLGWYYYHGYLDYDRALEQFAIARKSQPNNSYLLGGIGAVQRRQGKFEQALVNIKKSSELNPLSSAWTREVGTTYDILRYYPEAERYYDSAISLAPDNPSNYDYKAWLYIQWEGNTEKARAVIEEAIKYIGKEDTDIINTQITLDVYDGNYQEALNRFSLKDEDIDDQSYFIPRDLRYALIYSHMNKYDSAQTYYDKARIILESKIQEQTDDARFHSSLGIAYAGLGRREDAIREGKLGVALLPISKEAMAGLRRLEDLARIYVMVGEYDSAVEQLEFLLSRPGIMTVHLLRLDPIWAPLREHPRFKALLKKMGLPETPS